MNSKPDVSTGKTRSRPASVTNHTKESRIVRKPSKTELLSHQVRLVSFGKKQRRTTLFELKPMLTNGVSEPASRSATPESTSSDILQNEKGKIQSSLKRKT